MKKIYLILIALVTLSSLSSCEKGGDADLGPVHVLLLVNKQSDLYKDMEKAFAKNDYTDHAPEDEFKPEYDGEQNGFNNVYFLQNGEKQKLRYSFGDSNIIEDFSHILYKKKGISEEYVYLLGSELSNQELFTNKDEEFLLKYDDKEIALKIKGAFGNNRSFARVEHFYVNDKKMKHLASDFTQDVVLFLTE